MGNTHEDHIEGVAAALSVAASVADIEPGKTRDQRINANLQRSLKLAAATALLHLAHREMQCRLADDDEGLARVYELRRELREGHPGRCMDALTWYTKHSPFDKQLEA